MKWLKQWVSGTAYTQTIQRLDITFDSIEIYGLRGVMEERAKKELDKLHALIHGSRSREVIWNEYRERLEVVREKEQKEKDSN